MARNVAYLATVENAKAEGRLVPGVGLQPWMDKGGHGHEDRNQPL